MKKFLLLMLFPLLCVSCSNHENYLISGLSPDSSYDGYAVYLSLFDNGEVIDSTIIENGKFEFKGHVDQSMIVRLDMAQVIYSFFILEKGAISVDISDPNCAQGTPLNEQLSKLNEEIDIVYMSWAGQMKDLLRRQYKSDALEIQEIQILNESLDKYYSIYDKVLAQNRNNALGFYILWQAAQEMDEERFEMLYSQAGDYITSDPVKVEIIAKSKNQSL